jgi:hypothetical protein
LEIEELECLLSSIGLKVSERRLEELMSKYDADGDGCLEIFEFIILLRAIHREAFARMKELLEYPVMVLASDPTRPYVPPETGYLHISVIDNLIHKKEYRVLTSAQKDYILHAVKGMNGNFVPSMIVSAVEHLKIRLDEALSLSDVMLKESHDKMEITRGLIFQIDNTSDATQFLHSLFHSSRVEMTRLKREFGMLLRPMLGNPTGYYMLDLSKSSHRKCLNKLSAISASQAELRKEHSKVSYGRFGDLSQKGNWSSFRNEMFNGNPMTMTLTFCSPIPTTGKLEFDFSCTLRPSKDDLPLADDRIVKLLTRYFLLEPKDVGVAFQKLFDWKVKGQLNLACNGLSPYECSFEKMRAAGDYMHEFYEHLNIRWIQSEEALEKLSRPAAENHGKHTEAFEKDKYLAKYTISDHFRKIQDEHDVKHAVKNLGANIPVYNRTARRMSVTNAKGLRQRARSLIEVEDASESSSSSSSSSGDEVEGEHSEVEEEKNDENDENREGNQKSVRWGADETENVEGENQIKDHGDDVKEVTVENNGENSGSDKDDNGTKKPFVPPALNSISFHSFRLKDTQDDTENGEEVGETATKSRKSLRPAQMRGSILNTSDNEEDSSSQDSDNMESFHKLRPTGHVDWYEAIQDIKEQALKRKKKDLALLVS